MALPALPPDHQPSMATHFFDTHAYVKKLKAAGVPEVQAEAHVETLVEIVENGLATKLDIHNLRKDIKETKKELKDDIKETRKEISEVKKELQKDIQDVRKELKNLDEKVDKMEDRLLSKLTIRLGGLMASFFTIFGIIFDVLIKIH